MPKCVFTHEHFDWQDDLPPGHSWSSTVIYETHLRGFTMHPSSGVAHPGTYRGLMEKIPYLKALGVTAVELMPVHEFNEHQVVGSNPQTGKPLRNYWGYDPVAFFAPKASYSSAGGHGAAEAGVQGTGSGAPSGGYRSDPGCACSTIRRRGMNWARRCVCAGLITSFFTCWRQIKATTRIIRVQATQLTPIIPWCGHLIMSALRYWVVEMHVDGFRFDLASVLGRDGSGQPAGRSPLLERIAEDPILRDVKIIAEAWDAAGAFEVGSFSEQRWAEWNGRYRDDVRRFWRGDDGMLGLFASRICGSADIYSKSGKGPECSINFVHLPRRLHAERSGELSHQAQSGKR